MIGELKEWFGAEAGSYQLMRIYRIPFAQPNQVIFTADSQTTCGLQMPCLQIGILETC